MGQFNREKTPERVVHARGMVAKGYFEVRCLLCWLLCLQYCSLCRHSQPGVPKVAKRCKAVRLALCCSIDI